MTKSDGCSDAARDRPVLRLKRPGVLPTPENQAQFVSTNNFQNSLFAARTRLRVLLARNAVWSETIEVDGEHVLRPLAIGVHVEIFDALAPTLATKRLQKAVRRSINREVSRHVSLARYKFGLLRLVTRLHFDGTPAQTIDDSHRQTARGRFDAQAENSHESA